MKTFKIVFFIFFIFGLSNLFSQTDGCGSNATLLTPNTSCTYVVGNTTGFTDSNQGCDAGNEDDDGFFRFVATSTSHGVTVDGDTGFDAVVGVYNSCGGSQPSGGTCVDASGNGGVETLNLTGLSIGNTYYISVHDYGSGGGTFNICVTTPPPPDPGDACISALPFCSSNSYTFPNGVNQPAAPSGYNYGCLSSVPNPIWYYMQVGTSGPIRLNLTQTSNTGGALDVDFAMWGPFTSLSNACSSISSGTAPIQSGYSISNTEILGLGVQGGSYLTATNCIGVTTPPAAVAGQIYVVVISNYSNSPGNITFNQTNANNAGAGSANCGIVPCNISNVTAVPGACQSASNTFNVTGSITATAPPSSGTLTISASCGGTPLVLSPPFSTTVNYTLTGIPATTGACSISVVYSADPNCVRTVAFTPPAPCRSCPTVLSGDGIVLSNGSSLPNTITCGTAPFEILASNNATFGSPITPGVMMTFLNNNNTNNSVTWYENGTNVACFGPSASCLPLTTNTNTQLQFYFASPSAVNTFTLCETNTAEPNMTYTVTDLASGNVITSGTWLDDGICQGISIPAGAITGTATFTASCGSCITSTDWGSATFNPTVAGPGTHTITYTYNPNNGCAPYTFSKTITITKPDFNLTAANNQICSGTNTTITATNVNPTVTFSNTNDYTIPDNNTTGVSSNINVSGLAGTVGNQLVNVLLNINHPNAADLNISLRCPDGTIIVLSTDNGATGDNYVNTIFSPTATTNITAGTAPFTGTFLPEQLFSDLSACTLNGTWTLIVSDDNNTNSVVGNLLDWSITFNNPLTYTWAPPTGLSATTGSVITANPTSTTTYTVTGTDGSGCNETKLITITVLPAPTVTSTNSLTICSGNSVNLNLTSDINSSFSWIAASNANVTGESTTAQTGSIINNTLTVTSNAVETVTYSVTPTSTANSCPGPQQIVTVTINPLPSISPMNNINTSCINTPVTVPNFTVLPSGTTVNWSNNNSAIGGLGASGTGNIGTFTPTSPGVATISANATVGTCTITPVTFSITVNALPNVTATSTTACSGQSASITASGANTYSWNTGATTATLTINPATTTTTYTVTGTNTLTTCSNTANGTITITPGPVMTSPSTGVTCSGASANFPLTSTIAGTTYSWLAASNANVTGESTTTQSGATIGDILSNTSAVDQDVIYSITPTNGSCAGTPQTVTITVSVNPAITGTPSACLGATSQLTGFGNPAVSNPWTSSNTAVATVNSSGLVTSVSVGSTTIRYTDDNGCFQTITFNVLPTPTITGTLSACVGATSQLTGSGTAATTTPWTSASTAVATVSTTGLVTAVASGNSTITYTNSSGCQATATFTVNALPVISGTLTACVGVTSALNATGTAATTNPWQSSNTAVATITSAGIVSAVSSGNSTITFTTNNGCSSTATFTVNPTPSITNSIVTTTGCGTATANLTPTSTVAGTTFNWTASSSGGTLTGFSASGTGNINETITNSGTTSGTVTYVITPVASGCPGTPVNYSVVVNPGPTVTNVITTTTGCGTAVASLIPTSNVAGATFEWTSTSTGSTLTGNSANGNGSINESITNAGNSTGTVVYSITPSANSCNGPAVTYSVVVNPLPQVTNTITNTTGCETAVATLSPTSNVTGATFNWTATNTSGTATGFSNGTGTINQTITNTGAGTATVVYAITASAAGCSGTPVNYTVTIYKNPTITISGTSSYCSGGNSVLTASGANTYTWTPSATLSASNGNSVTASPTLTTIYTVNGTDANTCVGTGTFTLTVNTNPTAINFSVTPSACNAPTGSVTINNSTGGSPAYQYNFNNLGFSSTTSYTGLAAGSYSIIVRDQNNCTFSTFANIITATGPTAVSTTLVKDSCGRNTGVIQINTVTGGTPGYQFSVDNSALSSTSIYQNLAVGLHSIVVTDNAGCSYATSVTIQALTGPTGFSTQVTNETCSNSNGVITVNNVNGGTAAYTYSSNGSAFSGNASFTNLAAGTYTVVVKDANTCTFTNQVSVTNSPAPTAVASTVQNSVCNQSNGSITLGTVTGGTSPFIFNINNGAFGTSNVFSNLAANTYTIVVKDANNCTFTSQIVLSNANLTVQLTNSITTTTGCETAIASLTPTANQPNATYSWTASNTGGTITGFTATGTGNINQVLTNNSNSQGTVTYIITPSASGCTGTPSNYSVVINPKPTITNVITPTSGCGTANALLNPTSTVTGSTFSWTAQNSGASLTGYSSTGNGSINETLTNTGTSLGTLIYSITPTFNSCVGTPVNYTVNVNPIPAITNAPNATTGCGSVNALYNPVSNLTGSSFSWTVVNTGGVLNGYTTPGTGVINQSITNNGSAAGTLVYAITPAANGCNGNAVNYAVTVNPVPTIINTIDTTRGCGTVTANLNPVANVSGATFSWSAINYGGLVTGYTAINGFGSINETLNNTSSSTGIIVYTIIPSVGNCTGTSVNYPVVVNPVPQITNTITTTNGCRTANALLNLTSNVIGTSYSWTAVNIGAALTGFTTSGTGNINQTITNNGTSSGTVVYNITPSAGTCTGLPVTYSIVVNPQPTIVGTSSVCSGGTSTLSGSGTASNFNPWSSSNTAVATVSAGVVNAVSSGTTTITYQDINSCTATSTFTVIATPTVTVPSSFTVCEGTSQPAITLITTPPGATIQWNNDNLGTGVAQSGATGLINGFTAINSTSANIVSVISVNASSNVCNSIQQSFSITVVPTPTLTVSSNSPVCVNGVINLNSSGGTIYSWTGPNNYTSSNQNTTINNVSLVMGGTYSISVGVSGGGNLVCQSTSTISVVVNPLPVVNITNNSPVCEGKNIELIANSIGAQTYSWAGPSGFSSNNQNPIIQNSTSSMAGNYTVTVTDNNNCINANITNVVINPIPSLPITSNEVFCENETPLPLTAVSNFGGTLNWYGTNLTGGFPTINSPTPSTSVIGTYTYYVSQTVLGCESPRAPLVVTINPRPTALISFVPPQCAPLCTDISFLSTSTLNDVQWNFGDGTLLTLNDTVTHCYDLPGAYSITLRVTDNNGCSNNLIFPNWVNVNENPTALFDYQPTNITLLNPNVNFVSQSLGDSIITYSWSFGDQQNSGLQGQSVEHIYESAGIYDVQLAVQTVYGCVDTVKRTIEVFEDFNVYIPNSFSPNGDGVNEEFYPQGTGISDIKFSFEIYDRWGELIFATTDLTKHWNGVKLGGSNIVQQDVYVYKISCQSTKGDKFSKTGHVTLLR
jgi:gliding motility-associated-like protein